MGTKYHFAAPLETRRHRAILDFTSKVAERQGRRVGLTATSKNSLHVSVILALVLVLCTLSISSEAQTRSIADRRTADSMLKQARQSISAGNLSLAEWYVQRAETLDVSYDSVFQRFVDTPEKVRQAINAKRNSITPAGGLAAPTNAKEAVQRAIASDAVEENLYPRQTQANAEQMATAKQTATQFLEKGMRAMSDDQINEALRWYHSAVAVGADFSDDEFSPARLAEALTQRGVSQAKLRSPSTPVHVPTNIVDDVVKDKLFDPAVSAGIAAAGVPSSNTLLERGIKINTETAAQQQGAHADSCAIAKKLLAESKVALDRGEIAQAKRLATQAQEMRIPDVAYDSGDVRPWMLLMEISRHENRESSFQSAPVPSSVAQSGQVVPSTYDPLIDQTRNLQATRLTPKKPLGSSVGASNGVSVPMPTHETSAPLLTGPAPRSTMSAAPLFPPSIPPDVDDPQLPRLNGLTPSPDHPGMAPIVNSDGSPLLPPQTLDELTAPQQSYSPNPPAQITAPESSDLPNPTAGVTGPGAIHHSHGSPPAEITVTQGDVIFQEGEAALSKQDTATALKHFREAWKYESEMDPTNRQRLQDHLQDLAYQDASNRPQPSLRTNGMPDDRLTDPPAEPAVLPRVDQDKVRQLMAEIGREQVTINALRNDDPMAAWAKIKALKQTVVDADIDEQNRSRMLGRVDAAARDMEKYIETNRSIIENDQRNKKLLAEIDRSREQRVRNQQKLADLVNQHNQLIDQQRFSEAMIVAKQAAEIDPNNPVVQNILWRSQVARQVMTSIARSQQFEENTNMAWNDVLKSATPIKGDIEFPDRPYWDDLTKRRREALAANERRFSEAELEIQRALQTDIDVFFEDTPLSAVLEKLAELTGINIFLDPGGLIAENVSSDEPVSIKLANPVTLTSALNLILAPLHLGYVVQDEVLRITSEQVRDGDVFNKVYNVADLVIPIASFGPSSSLGLPTALREAHARAASQGYAGGHQSGALQIAEPSMTNENSTALAQLGFGNPAGGNSQGHFNSGGGGTGLGAGSSGGGAQADFDTLIDLITTTVAPETWVDVGGTGTARGFANTLSLVVSTTQEVHEQIADLLAQLRRLQDLQVTIEVRFITLSDDFFERIGVDFDFDLDDNTGLSPEEALLKDDDGPSVTIGLDPSGVPTVDLDVGFTQGSFGATIPSIGGFDASAAANIGFAILSDIEAFFVIQASQGDSRTNILQAPKVTLFNGMTATVSDQQQTPFVTSITPVVGDFAAAYQPVITVLSEGTTLSVQAVVSQDRRFVRLTLVPFFSQIGEVNEFTYEGSSNSNTGTNVIDPSDEENTLINNAFNARQGTTVQLPTFSFTSVSTTVSVPDGGTILLGGIKRLQEGRTERGVPMLSKLPYISRLFRNVGIGRETQSLMMMVTPRIIIQEEEEDKMGLVLPSP